MGQRLSTILLLIGFGVLGCSAAVPSTHQASETRSGLAVAEAPPAPQPLLLDEAEWHSPAAPGDLGQGGAPLLIHTDPGDLPQLHLASDPSRQLSLQHTHVSAKLTGFVAEVEVTQTYTNPFSEPIEALYVFPLPENSAVNHLRMTIDQRVIEADVKEREQAKRLYDHAKRSGQAAALLEQERPNVFTQSVANIAPGKKIEVTLRYLQDLTYDAGEYEFVFPLVVGPRYLPGSAQNGAPRGSGSHADTDRVPDASRISPPYVGKGERSGRTVSLELVADPQLAAVANVEVPTHQVATRRAEDGTLRLSLAEKASIPNRDFVLRYRVAGPKPRATLYQSGGESGFFSLVLQPPELDVEQLVGQRELVFVVDVSGSMTGQPLQLCKAAMREALRRLRPVDTFNILTFAGRVSQAFTVAQPANNANVREALRLVDDLHAGGGTELANAVDASLGARLSPGRNRYVFFMTDGFVGNEDDIIRASRRYVSELRGGKARVFGFGVGSSVNRHLIDGLSQAGEGVAVYATTREDPLRGVDRFFHYIDRAVLEQVHVDFGGWQTQQVFPNPTPDLFASHPLVLHGRYSGKPRGKLVVHARVNGKALDLPLEAQVVSAELGGERVLGTLWAREKLTELDDDLLLGRGNAQQQITKLGLDFHLVTRFTSLLAVDRNGPVVEPPARQVVEPLDEPEGVDVAQAGGEQAMPAQPTAPVGIELDEPMASAPEAQLFGVQQRRGCGCRAAGEGTSSPLGLGVALALLGLIGARQRRGRAARRALG